MIRACNPFYNYFTFFRNVNMKIIKASIIKKEHNLKFGEIALVSEKELIVAAKGGYLALETFQIGTWGIFSPSEFNMIFSPKVGELLV